MINRAPNTQRKNQHDDRNQRHTNNRSLPRPFLDNIAWGGFFVVMARGAEGRGGFEGRRGVVEGCVVGVVRGWWCLWEEWLEGDLLVWWWGVLGRGEEGRGETNIGEGIWFLGTRRSWGFLFLDARQCHRYTQTLTATETLDFFQNNSKKFKISEDLQRD
jgi:hypothetical protein